MKHYLPFIGLLSVLFLLVLNSDLLYMVQSRSLFMSGSIFLADCLRVPGGFLTWLSLWFTQFFYYPVLGGSMLIVLWLALYVVLQRAFRPSSSWSWVLLIPVVALLVSTVDLGYWIYLLKQHGYWFRESLGILFVALMLWVQGQECASRRSAVAIALSLISYPLLGWYAVLASLCVTMRELCRAIKSRSGWALPVVAMVALSFLPPLVAGRYDAFRLEEAFYAGFPVIESNLDFSWMLTMPFVVVGLSLVLLCLLPVQKPLKLGRYPWVLHVLVMALLTGIVVERNVEDANYHAEMRLYRDVEEFRWKEVLQEMRDAAERGGSTRQMALCKDLALINLHRLDQMFEYSNGDVNRVMRDSCGAYMLYTCGPLLALHHGMTNTAIRWNIESSVEYGLSVSTLKVLTLAALINGESKVADKYLTMLNLNLFQSDWVRRYGPLVADPSLIEEYPELSMIRLMHSYPDDDVYGDKGHVEAELYKSFSNLINVNYPAIQEIGVYYALKEKNPTRFWPQLRYYLQLNPGKKGSAVVNDAAFIMHHHHTGGLSMNFSKDIQNRFDAFNNYISTHAHSGMSNDEIGEMIKNKFGKTYWWYYYFNNTKPY